jgi:GNAT superfamily N-acetyltransferase
LPQAAFTLRDAVEADVPEIRRLTRCLADYEKLLHEAVATEDDFRRSMFGPQPRAWAILAEVQDAPPVGIAVWYYTYSTFMGRPDIYLEDLFVDPSHRGSGIGLAMFRRLAQRAVAENCRRIDWQVLKWNQPSIEFYHRIGARQMQDWHVMNLSGDALRALAEGASHG